MWLSSVRSEHNAARATINKGKDEKPNDNYRRCDSNSSNVAAAADAAAEWQRQWSATRHMLNDSNDDRRFCMIVTMIRHTSKGKVDAAQP